MKISLRIRPAAFALLFLPPVLLQPVFAGDYYPMADGNHWYYDQIDSAGAPFGKDTAEMTERTIGGVPGFGLYEVTRNTLGGGSGDLYLRDSGQIVYASSDQFNFNSPRTYAYHSYANVTEFTGTPRSLYSVKYVGTVTVPAGVFDSCYEVTQTQPYPGPTETFAPGVGRIKYLAEAKWTLQLTGYKTQLSQSGIHPLPRNGRSAVPFPLYDLIGRLHPIGKSRVRDGGYPQGRPSAALRLVPDTRR